MPSPLIHLSVFRDLSRSHTSRFEIYPIQDHTLQSSLSHHSQTKKPNKPSHPSPLRLSDEVRVHIEGWMDYYVVLRDRRRGVRWLKVEARGQVLTVSFNPLVTAWGAVEYPLCLLHSLPWGFCRFDQHFYLVRHQDVAGNNVSTTSLRWRSRGSRLASFGSGGDFRHFDYRLWAMASGSPFLGRSLENLKT